jgi:hypothetical protein
VREPVAAAALDEAHVGSGGDAQLDSALAHSGVGPSVPCQALADVPGQQLGLPSRDMREFSAAAWRCEVPAHKQAQMQVLADVTSAS